MQKIQSVLLVILDGFGLAKPGKSNAITSAKTPTINRFFRDYAWTPMDAAGLAVGLPENQMGTSEVGHLNLGAGRIVNQDLVRINKTIEERSFFQNNVLLQAVQAAKKPGSALHLLGLCSDGGVHSHLNHLFGLLELAKQQKINHVFIHIITDGRDTPPRAAQRFIAQIEERCHREKIGEIATIIGRYYAMDRVGRWDREQRAYNALVKGEGLRFPTAKAALALAYRRGEGDEFVQPSIITTKDHRTTNIIAGDSVIFFNFRQDRARQLTHGFTDEHFTHFLRKKIDLHFTTFTNYDATLHLPVAFPPEDVVNSLAEWLSKNGVRQFHIAETEKYAHVTYFFNGGREERFRGEERVLIPSPRIATYDLQPAMSAEAITTSLITAMRSKTFGFLVANYANVDMVGHTGKIGPTIKAVEVVDRCLSRLETEAQLQNVLLLVTADHGNAEEMSGEHQTSHTLNKVPFIVVHPAYNIDQKILHPIPADVATTILHLMGLPHAPGMTGRILVK